MLFIRNVPRGKIFFDSSQHSYRTFFKMIHFKCDSFAMFADTNILFHSIQYFNETFIEMVHFQCFLPGMFDNEMFSATQLNSSIKRWLKWFDCIVISGIFGNEIFFATQLNISIKLWFKWFISNVFCPASSIMRYSLQLKSILWWNSAEKHWLFMGFTLDVRWSMIPFNSPYYSNRTIFHMVHFKCGSLTMLADETFSSNYLNSSIKRWLKWFILNVIHSQCSSRQHFVRLILTFQ